MNLTQIRHAITVYKAGTFSGAASLLYVSQSALSKSIATLEEELGSKIFTRHYHGIALTPFGEQFMRYAEEMMAKEKLILDLANGHDEKGKPVFRVAADYLRFAGYAYVKVAERNASLLMDLSFSQRNNSGVLLEVINKRADIGILRIFVQNRVHIIELLNNSGLVYSTIARCPTLVTLTADHPLTREIEGEEITPEQLRPYPFRVISEQMLPFYTMQVQYAQRLGADKLLEGEFNYSDGSMRLESDAYLCVADMSQAYERQGLDPIADTYCKSYLLPRRDMDQEIGWVRHKDTALSFLEEEYLAELTSLCRPRDEE